MTILVRLVDREGITVCEMALPDEPDRPRPSIYVSFAPNLKKALQSPEPDAVLDIHQVEYRLERQDGGGTYIYRRHTPLWLTDSPVA